MFPCDWIVKILNIFWAYIKVHQRLCNFCEFFFNCNSELTWFLCSWRFNLPGVWILLNWLIPCNHKDKYTKSFILYIIFFQSFNFSLFIYNQSNIFCKSGLWTGSEDNCPERQKYRVQSKGKIRNTISLCHTHDVLSSKYLVFLSFCSVWLLLSWDYENRWPLLKSTVLERLCVKEPKGQNFLVYFSILKCKVSL